MKKILNYILVLIYKRRLGKKILSYIGVFNMNQYENVKHNNINLYFMTPNWINSYRAATFATKEPETLEWIENIVPGSIIWDIGANVGLYSIYASKLNKGKVFAFEPSVFNLEILSRNIYINNLQDNITIIPIPLSNSTSNNLFQMTSTQWGGALSTFGASIDQNGNPIKEIFEYKILGTSIDEMLKTFQLKNPDYIKIDVDGIEHLILTGASEVLLKVRSVLIEIDDNFIEQTEKSKILLEKAGLVLFKKCKIDSTNQYNQWWVRK